MNKNWQRLMTDEQIKSVKEQLAIAITDDANYIAGMLVDFYLMGDSDGLFANVEEMVEAAEEGRLLSIDQINMILREDCERAEQ